MKRHLFLSAIFSCAALFCSAGTTFAQQKTNWVLAWSDEFNGSKIDEKKWSKIPRGKSDWNNYMSDNPSLYAVKNGNLILRAKPNAGNKKDPVPFITGGIYSHKKFAFRYGKIEIRAKFDNAKGMWPAIWLLPDHEGRKWPDDGEIDIVEHLNFDNFAYQTVHTKITKSGVAGAPKSGSTGPINKDDYNVYGLEWYPDKLVFFINGKETFTYPKVDALVSQGQWPFTEKFYILLDMQVEGSWVGNAEQKDFPKEIKIDWVRVYRNASLAKKSAAGTTKSAAGTAKSSAGKASDTKD